jgi:hypothetical protein
LSDRPATCPNCGTEGVLQHCPGCGQKRIHEGDLSLGHAWHHLTHELLHLDGRILNTFKLLLLRPGQLTLDFWEGRRQRHVNPLRVFLVASALFFVAGNQAFYNLRHIASRDGSGRLARYLPALARRHGMSEDAFVAQRNLRLQLVNKSLIVASVPAGGLLLAVVYRRRRRYLAEHQVFALHVASWRFAIGLPLGFLGVALRHPYAPLAVQHAALLAYFVLAARRAYGGPTLGHVLRGLAFAAFELAVAMAAMWLAITYALRG